jgi:hypothetical protein
MTNGNKVSINDNRLRELYILYCRFFVSWIFVIQITAIPIPAPVAVPVPMRPRANLWINEDCTGINTFTDMPRANLCINVYCNQLVSLLEKLPANMYNRNRTR